MLEDIALKYVSQTEEEMHAISFGLSILGGVIAGVTTRSTNELRRAPYFALIGLIFLASAITQVVWLGTLSAMNGGYLWALKAVDLVKSLAFGYFLCVFSMARSRNAFGTGSGAALGFIPIANLVLLLKDSKKQSSVNQIATAPILTGGLGVLSGFAMVIAAVVLTGMITKRISEDSSMELQLQAASTDLLIRNNGLGATLAQLAAEVTVPQKIDEVTTLRKIEADATSIRYLYIVDGLDRLLDGFERNLIQSMCANDAMRPILVAGGVVEQAYYKADGRELGTVRITSRSCGE